MAPKTGRKIAASKKKKQTRLTFDPIDQTSSPAPSGPSPAKVRYTQPTSSLSKPSSSTHIGDGSDSDDILLSSRKPASKSRFIGLEKNGKLPTPAKSSQQIFGRNKRSRTLEDDSEDEIAQTTFTPQPTRSSSKMRTSSRISSAHKSSLAVDGSTLEEEYTPSKAKSSNGKAVAISSEDEDEQTSKPTNTRSRKLEPSSVGRPTRSASQKAQTYIELSSDSNSQEFELPRHGKSNQAKKPLFSSIPKGKSSSPHQEEEDSDSDEVVMSTQAARRKRQPVTVPIDDEEDSEDPISSPLKRARQVVESDESDDSDIVSSPLKRRRQNKVYSENEESEDELQITNRKPRASARDASPSRTTRQSKVRKHRTEKEKKLELLKRRRAGENIEALTESEESNSEDESGSDFQKLSEFEDEEEEEVTEKPHKHVKKKRNTNVDGKDLDAYDSDFIEDDEDGNIGVPTHSLLDIPLEFTHAAHKPLKEHFKDAVEWMVHNKINPAFARNDPLYVQAFKKLDDEYGGYANSKFVSTQWTAEFTRAIYARPEFLVRGLAPGEEIEIAGEVICQVCNHRKYVPKYEIQFAGKAYHKDSLEEVEQDDSSDDSDGVASTESQKRSVNADGQVIPSEEQTWLSGQYCKANAEQAHSLIHWKYALNQWVLGNLEFEGYLTPKKLAERESMKAKKRRKCANDIVDNWEAHSQIKDLYRDFKINLEAARNATPANFRNGRFRAG